MNPWIVVGLFAGLGALLFGASTSSGATMPARTEGDGDEPPTGGGHGSSSPVVPPSSSSPVVPPSSSSVAPLPGGGRDFVHSLPETATPAREARILDAVKQGFIRPIDWQPVSYVKDGRLVTVFVADDALAVGTANDFVRVNVSAQTAQRIADVLAANLPTSRISDEAWRAATVKLKPHRQTPDAHMADTLRMLAHHDAIETERGGRTGLVRTVGKDWVISERMKPHPDGTLARPLDDHGNELGPEAGPAAINFGWPLEGAPDHSLSGVPVLQPLGRRHNDRHVDYSQTLCLVRGDCIVDGRNMLVVDALRDPDVAYLLSDEVQRGTPCVVWRQPSVPQEIAA